MKTTEDKARFSALYWGQEVLFNTLTKSTYTIDVNKSLGLSQTHLQLTSLQNITDEHAKACMKELYPAASKNLIAALSESLISNCQNGKLFEAYCYSFQEQITILDFLRKHGYLVPFDKYSCEEIIEMGWAKIRES